MRRGLSGLFAALLTASVLVVANAGAAHAADVTTVHVYPGVVCDALIGTSHLQRVQDVTIAITAPDSATPGSTFTVTFLGGSAPLPTRSNGLNITSYSNLFQTVQINGTNFNAGSIVNPGSAAVLPSASTATSWSPATSYAIGTSVFENLSTTVVADFHFYQSLTAGNLNHDPKVSPTFWTEVTQDATSQWSSTISYASGAYAISGGVYYSSLTAANLNHPPATSPANWAVVAASAFTTPNSASLVAPNQIKYGQPGPFGTGNQSDAASATLTTPDVSVSATMPASGDATLNMVSLTTMTSLNNGALTAAVTCAIPTDIIVTIPGGPPNTPPTVNAGSDATGNLGDPIAVSGTVTDPDNTPTHAWTIDSPFCNFADPSALSTTVTCTHAGVFAATLTGDDGANSPVTDTAQITVTSPNLPPVVSAGPNKSGQVGDDIPLDGTVTDNDSDPNVLWTVDSPNCDFDDPTVPDVVINCTVAGTYAATLTADDGVNAPVSDSTQVTISPIPPGLTVTAGPDATGNTNTAILLKGKVTDPGHTPTAHWTIDSPNCSFANAALAQTTVTCTAPGVFAATLTGHDGVNPDQIDTAFVTVIRPNVAPTVSAGPDVSGVINTAIALDGTVGDPDDTPTILWHADSPTCSFGNAAAIDTTITCTTGGVFAATLTADDGTNPPVSDVALVNVVSNVSPTVNAGPDVSGGTNTPIALSGSAFDPDNSLTLHWATGSPTCSFANPNAAATTITCTAGGVVAATLTAGDGVNTPVSDTALVTVIAPNTPPTVSAGTDLVGVVNHTLNLDGTVTDPDETPVVHWATGNPSCSFGNANVVDTTFICSAPGIYAVTLTADDGVNMPVSDTALVTYTAAACTGPCISIGDASAYEGGGVSLPVTLNAPLSTATTVKATIIPVNSSNGAGLDFKTAVVHNVKIPANKVEAWLTIKALDDAVVGEGNETFKVDLSDVSPGVSIGRTEGIGTILDADGPGIAPGQLLVGTSTIVETDCTACTAVAKVSVVLSAPAAATVSVKYTSVNAGATAGVDYTAKVNRTLSFAAGGSRSKSITIAILGDTAAEPTDGIAINFSVLNPPTLTFPNGTGHIDILDND